MALTPSEGCFSCGTFHPNFFEGPNESVEKVLANRKSIQIGGAKMVSQSEIVAYTSNAKVVFRVALFTPTHLPQQRLDVQHKGG